MSDGKLALVKGEWDEAENWLGTFIDNQQP